MRVVFLGSPPFAVPVFERVLASRHTVAALVTRPDKPKGRGMKVESSALVESARRRSIPIVQPATTKDAGFVGALREFEPDVLLVASYGEILRRDVLELASNGALNVHASLLPRWRGASPIQAAILAGDEETGVSVQRMVLALDEGDVLIEKRTLIGAHEDAGQLLERLAELGAGAAVEALDAIESGRARFTPQDAARATFARKIAKEHGRIDWTRSAREIDRQVRAFTPWPGARTTLGGHDLGVLDVRIAANELARSVPGTCHVAKDELRVSTGDGALAVMRVKPAGKAAMDTASWLRGARLANGARFDS